MTLFKIKSIVLLFVSLLIFSTCHKDDESSNKWAILPSPSQGLRLLDIQFTDEKTGFIVGSYARDEPNVPFEAYDVLLTTTNGGESWQMSKTGISIPFKSIYALNDKVLYATNHGVYKSNNGGGSWTLIGNLEAMGSSAFDVYFWDEQIGFTVKNGIYKTIDGGTSWQLTYYHDQDYRTLNRILFPSPLVGYAYGGATYDSFNAGLLVKTTDGGDTWQELSGSFTNIMAMYFLDEKAGYLFTFNRELFKTTNGGASWKKINDHVPGIVNSCYFENEQHGYIATSEGGIYSTKSSGRKWGKEYQGKSFMNALYFPNQNTGYAISQGGEILKRR